jgi:putative spermidine/putrescine transport system permease protein
MRRHTGEKLWAFAVWTVVVFFIVNLLAMIGAVTVNSFGPR